MLSKLSYESQTELLSSLVYGFKRLPDQDPLDWAFELGIATGWIRAYVSEDSFLFRDDILLVLEKILGSTLVKERVIQLSTTAADIGSPLVNIVFAEEQLTELADRVLEYFVCNGGTDEFMDLCLY